MTDLKMCSETTESRGLINSIKGLSQLLQVSTVTAQAIKNSGRIPYMQIGRTILFDPIKVLAALEQNPKSRK